MSYWVRICALAVFAFATFAMAGGAQAQTITVVGVDPSGMDPRLAADVTTGALRGAAGVGGFSVEDYTHVGVSDTMQLLGCSEVDDRCLQDFASTLGSRVVVIGQLRQAAGPILDVTVYDAGVARTIVQAAVALPATGVAEYVAYHVGAFLNGRLVIQVTSAPASGAVFIDGVPLGVAPVTTDAFAPGPHAIRVEFADGRTGNLDVVLGNAGRFVLTVAASGRAGTPSPGPSDRVSDGVRPLRVVGWTGVTLGVAAAAVATVGGLQVRSAEQDFEATPFQRAADAAAERGDRAALMTNVAIGVGAVAVVGGIAALLLDRNGARADRAITAGIAPTVGGASALFRLDL